MKMMVQLMLLIEVPNTKRAAENLGSVRSEWKGTPVITLCCPSFYSGKLSCEFVSVILIIVPSLFRTGKKWADHLFRSL
jgi:hypothetical protein